MDEGIQLHIHNGYNGYRFDGWVVVASYPRRVSNWWMRGGDEEKLGTATEEDEDAEAVTSCEVGYRTEVQLQVVNIYEVLVK